MLERQFTIAKIEVTKYGTSEMKSIHPAIAFNVCNYLRFKGISHKFFIAHTCCISCEDRAVAGELGILLSDKEHSLKFFPNVSGLSKEEALAIFEENFKRLNQGSK